MLRHFRDDIVRAVKKLKVLGHGFQLIAMPGERFLVQSVPGEMVFQLF
jgi:ESCRT-II complex subunit VPS22